MFLPNLRGDFEADRKNSSVSATDSSSISQFNAVLSSAVLENPMPRPPLGPHHRDVHGHHFSHSRLYRESNDASGENSSNACQSPTDTRLPRHPTTARSATHSPLQNSQPNRAINSQNRQNPQNHPSNAPLSKNVPQPPSRNTRARPHSSPSASASVSVALPPSPTVQAPPSPTAPTPALPPTVTHELLNSAALRNHSTSSYSASSEPSAASEPLSTPPTPTYTPPNTTHISPQPHRLSHRRPHTHTDQHTQPHTQALAGEQSSAETMGKPLPGPSMRAGARLLSSGHAASPSPLQLQSAAHPSRMSPHLPVTQQMQPQHPLPQQTQTALAGAASGNETNEMGNSGLMRNSGEMGGRFRRPTSAFPTSIGIGSQRPNNIVYRSSYSRGLSTFFGNSTDNPFIPDSSDSIDGISGQKTGIEIQKSSSSASGKTSDVVIPQKPPTQFWSGLYDGNGWSGYRHNARRMAASADATIQLSLDARRPKKQNTAASLPSSEQQVVQPENDVGNRDSISCDGELTTNIEVDSSLPPKSYGGPVERRRAPDSLHTRKKRTLAHTERKEQQSLGKEREDANPTTLIALDPDHVRHEAPGSPAVQERSPLVDSQSIVTLDSAPQAKPNVAVNRVKTVTFQDAENALTAPIPKKSQKKPQNRRAMRLPQSESRSIPDTAIPLTKSSCPCGGVCICGAACLCELTKVISSTDFSEISALRQNITTERTAGNSRQCGACGNVKGMYPCICGKMCICRSDTTDTWTTRAEPIFNAISVDSCEDISDVSDGAVSACEMVANDLSKLLSVQSNDCSPTKSPFILEVCMDSTHLPVTVKPNKTNMSAQTPPTRIRPTHLSSLSAFARAYKHMAQHATSARRESIAHKNPTDGSLGGFTSPSDKSGKNGGVSVYHARSHGLRVYNRLSRAWRGVTHLQHVLYAYLSRLTSCLEVYCVDLGHSTSNNYALLSLLYADADNATKTGSNTTTPHQNPRRWNQNIREFLQICQEYIAHVRKEGLQLNALIDTTVVAENSTMSFGGGLRNDDCVPEMPDISQQPSPYDEASNYGHSSVSMGIPVDVNNHRRIQSSTLFLAADAVASQVIHGIRLQPHLHANLHSLVRTRLRDGKSIRRGNFSFFLNSSSHLYLAVRSLVKVAVASILLAQHIIVASTLLRQAAQLGIMTHRHDPPALPEYPSDAPHASLRNLLRSDSNSYATRLCSLSLSRGEDEENPCLFQSLRHILSLFLNPRSAISGKDPNVTLPHDIISALMKEIYEVPCVTAVYHSIIQSNDEATVGQDLGLEELHKQRDDFGVLHCENHLSSVKTGHAISLSLTDSPWTLLFPFLIRGHGARTAPPQPRPRSATYRPQSASYQPQLTPASCSSIYTLPHLHTIASRPIPASSSSAALLHSHLRACIHRLIALHVCVQALQDMELPREYTLTENSLPGDNHSSNSVVASPAVSATTRPENATMEAPSGTHSIRSGDLPVESTANAAGTSVLRRLTSRRVLRHPIDPQAYAPLQSHTAFADDGETGAPATSLVDDGRKNGIGVAMGRDNDANRQDTLAETSVADEEVVGEKKVKSGAKVGSSSTGKQKITKSGAVSKDTSRTAKSTDKASAHGANFNSPMTIADPRIDSNDESQPRNAVMTLTATSHDISTPLESRSALDAPTNNDHLPASVLVLRMRRHTDDEVIVDIDSDDNIDQASAHDNENGRKSPISHSSFHHHTPQTSSLPSAHTTTTARPSHKSTPDTTTPSLGIPYWRHFHRNTRARVRARTLASVMCSAVLGCRMYPVLGLLGRLARENGDCQRDSCLLTSRNDKFDEIVESGATRLKCGDVIFDLAFNIREPMPPNSFRKLMEASHDDKEEMHVDFQSKVHQDTRSGSPVKSSLPSQHSFSHILSKLSSASSPLPARVHWPYIPSAIQHVQALHSLARGLIDALLRAQAAINVTIGEDSGMGKSKIISIPGEISQSDADANLEWLYPLLRDLQRVLAQPTPGAHNIQPHRTPDEAANVCELPASRWDDTAAALYVIACNGASAALKLLDAPLTTDVLSARAAAPLVVPSSPSPDTPAATVCSTPLSSLPKLPASPSPLPDIPSSLPDIPSSLLAAPSSLLAAPSWLPRHLHALTGLAAPICELVAAYAGTDALATAPRTLETPAQSLRGEIMKRDAIVSPAGVNQATSLVGARVHELSSSRVRLTTPWSCSTTLSQHFQGRLLENTCDSPPSPLESTTTPDGLVWLQKITEFSRRMLEMLRCAPVPQAWLCLNQSQRLSADSIVDDKIFDSAAERQARLPVKSLANMDWNEGPENTSILDLFVCMPSIASTPAETGCGVITTSGVISNSLNSAKLTHQLAEIQTLVQHHAQLWRKLERTSQSLHQCQTACLSSAIDILTERQCREAIDAMQEYLQVMTTINTYNHDILNGKSAEMNVISSLAHGNDRGRLDDRVLMIPKWSPRTQVVDIVVTSKCTTSLNPDTSDQLPTTTNEQDLVSSASYFSLLPCDLILSISLRHQILRSHLTETHTTNTAGGERATDDGNLLVSREFPHLLASDGGDGLLESNREIREVLFQNLHAVLPHSLAHIVRTVQGLTRKMVFFLAACIFPELLISNVALSEVQHREIPKFPRKYCFPSNPEHYTIIPENFLKSLHALSLTSHHTAIRRLICNDIRACPSNEDALSDNSSNPSTDKLSQLFLRNTVLYAIALVSAKFEGPNTIHVEKGDAHALLGGYIRCLEALHTQEEYLNYMVGVVYIHRQNIFQDFVVDMTGKYGFAEEISRIRNSCLYSEEELFVPGTISRNDEYRFMSMDGSTPLQYTIRNNRNSVIFPLPNVWAWDMQRKVDLIHYAMSTLYHD